MSGFLLLHLFTKQLPGRPKIGVTSTEMPVRECIHPVLVIPSTLPSPIQNIFIHHRIHIQAFQSATQTDTVAGRFCKEPVKFHTYVCKVTGYHSRTAEIAEIGPYKILTVKIIRLTINFDCLAIVVEHYQPSLGNGGYICFDTLRSPHLALVPEEPTHLKPNGIGVVFAYCLIGETRRIRQIARLPRRRIHLVEQIHTINMTFLPVNFLLFTQKNLLDFPKKAVCRI